MVEDDDDALPAALQAAAAFGARLREARETAGLLQEGVQSKLGIPVRSLTRWENGHGDLSFDKVVRLADFYGVSTDWLAGRTPVRCRVLPGMVLVNSSALATLEDLVAAGKTIKDVPARLLRKPGIDYATILPSEPEVLTREAAATIEARMRSLWRLLGGSAL